MVPLELQSDPRRNFESELWKQVLALLAIKKMTSLHVNMELFGGTIEPILNTITYCFEKINVIGTNCVFLLSYRCYQATGYIPAMLFSGREMKLPNDYMFGNLLAMKMKMGSSLVCNQPESRRVDVTQNRLQIDSKRMKLRSVRKIQHLASKRVI